MLRIIALSLLTSSLVFAQDSKPTDFSVHEQLSKVMEESHKKIEGMSSMGDADMDFAQMMEAHHKAGIEMAKLQLKNGDDPKIKKMAQKMINEQTKEIAQFQQWMKKQHQ